MAHSRQAGYALIMVLWILVLLTSIALAFSTNVRTDTRAATSLTEQVRLRAAADAAIAYSIQRLTDAEAGGTKLDWGIPYEMPWPDANLRITMTSESAKIDINYAPRPLLIGLFQTVLPDAQAEPLADAVLDWRDRDDRRSPQGAEADDYRAAGRRALPTNKPFRQVSELGQVMGFNADDIARVTPHITVHGRRPRIDPYSANDTVLAAIPGLNRDLASSFVSYRDQQQQAGEKILLDMLGPGIRYLERRPQVGAVRLHAAASNPTGRTLVREAVVRITPRSGHHQILDWRQSTPEVH